MPRNNSMTSTKDTYVKSTSIVTREINSPLTDSFIKQILLSVYPDLENFNTSKLIVVNQLIIEYLFTPKKEAYDNLAKFFKDDLTMNILDGLKQTVLESKGKIQNLKDLDEALSAEQDRNYKSIFKIAKDVETEIDVEIKEAKLKLKSLINNENYKGF